MNRILVPLDHYSDLSRNASYYAIEFAKRTNSKVFFLFISDSPKTQQGSSRKAWQESYEKLKGKINALIEQGRKQPVEVEYYFCIDTYVKSVCEFAKNHKISKIVVALPHKDDISFERINKNIDSLRSKIKCQLLVVKPKDKINEITLTK